MAWGTTGCSVLISESVQKSCIAQKTVDYDSGEGSFPRIRAFGEVWFFATATRTITEIRGLSEAGAKAKVKATGANTTTWKTSTKSIIAGVSVSIPFEAYVKVTSMRRADQSGQYVVTVEETTTVTDGVETNGKTI